MRGDDRKAWAWIAALTLGAGGLRALGLNDGLWFDEIATLVDSVRLPFGSIVAEFPTNNQHSLYSVLAHASIAMLGESAWTLRLPAFLFGVATVPILYLFAREFCGRREALLTCLLLATSYHHIWFSQNARGYSALAFLIVLCSWLLLRLMREGRTSDAAWYAVAAALGAYTHLTMIFAVMAHAALCALALMRDRTRGDVRRTVRILAVAFVLSALFSFALYSPVLLDMKQFFVDEAKPAVVATPGWAVIEMIKGLRVGLGAGVGAVLAAGLLLAGLVSYVRQSPFVAGLFVLPGVAVVGVTLLLGRPIFPRFVFFLIGFGLLIVVRGALEAGRRLSAAHGEAIGSSLVVLVAAASVLAAVPNYRYPKQDYEGAMRFVDERRGPAEPVVTVGLTSFVYTRYYERDWVAIKSLDQFQQVRAKGQRVWVLYTLAGYIQHDTPDLMKVLTTECAEAAAFRGTVGNGDITVCAAPPVPVR